MVGMIRLSWVASWRWLLPPTSDLTSTSVVVVIASLMSKTTACRLTLRLAGAFAHLFFSDG
jgi:hypothetical protein